MSDDSRTPVRVTLGVGAGAATFKAVALASLLTQNGYRVRVAMTPAAQTYVAPLSFAAVLPARIVTGVDSIDDDGVASHIRLGRSDVFVVAPATADLIARLAHGHASDAVCLTALCSEGERLFCPAMNDRMWENRFVQRNVGLLEDAGWRRVGPVRGRLAEGYEGEGRMSEPDAIVSAVRSCVEGGSEA